VEFGRCSWFSNRTEGYFIIANLFIQLHAILFKDSVIVTWPMGHVELLEERLSTPCASLYNRDSPSLVPSSSTACAMSECTGHLYFMSFCLFVAPHVAVC